MRLIEVARLIRDRCERFFFIACQDETLLEAVYLKV